MSYCFFDWFCFDWMFIMEVNDIIRQERFFRRKLFMRLNILPWLLLVSFLCSFNVFVIYYTNNLYSAIKIDQLERIDRIDGIDGSDRINGSDIFRDISMNNYIMGFHREAIARGYGLWEIDDDTLAIRFAWIDLCPNDLLNKRVNVIDSDNVDNVDDVSNVDDSDNVDDVSNVFSIDDFELSLFLGMDLESDIKSGILLLLDFHLGNSSLDSILVNKLKLDISDFIGRRFSGFKTYNRLRNKKLR